MCGLTPFGEYRRLDDNAKNGSASFHRRDNIAHLLLAISRGNLELQALPSVYEQSASDQGASMLVFCTHIKDVFEVVAPLGIILASEVNLIVHLLTSAISPITLPVTSRQLDVHIVIAQLFQRVSRELCLSRCADWRKHFLIGSSLVIGEEMQSLSVRVPPFGAYALVMRQASSESTLRRLVS